MESKRFFRLNYAQIFVIYNLFEIVTYLVYIVNLSAQVGALVIVGRLVDGSIDNSLPFHYNVGATILYWSS